MEVLLVRVGLEEGLKAQAEWVLEEWVLEEWVLEAAVAFSPVGGGPELS